MQQKQSRGALSTTTDDTEVPRALAGSVATLIGWAFSVNFIPKAFHSRALIPPRLPAGRRFKWWRLCPVRTRHDRERVLTGIARAREQGAQLDRWRLEDTDSKKVVAIRNARRNRVHIRRIARDLGVGVGTVLRLTAEA